jgi:hypothetical protein
MIGHFLLVVEACSCCYPVEKFVFQIWHCQYLGQWLELSDGVNYILYLEVGGIVNIGAECFIIQNGQCVKLSLAIFLIQLQV